MADVDGDGLPEVVMFANGGNQSNVYIYTADGQLYRQFTLPSHPIAQPIVGDFTGTGSADILVATGGQVGLYSDVGELQWVHALQNVYSLQGLAGFDFDHDGLLEVVHTEASAVRIFTGASGDLRFEQLSEAEGSESFAHPQPVDVDGDGQAELAIAQHGTTGLGVSGLSLFEAPTNGIAVIGCEE